MLSLTYFFLLGFFSSDFFYSQSVFLKYMLASMMYPIGYYYFNTLERFQSLIVSLMWSLGIFVIFLIISNIFSLGSSDYLEESTYFGAGRVTITKILMVLVLISPLVFRFKFSKNFVKLNVVLILFAVIFVVLGVKRSALLGLSLGYFIYFIIAPQKTKISKGIFIIGMILFLTSPLYYSVLESRIEARQEAGRFEFSKAEDEEARVIELRAVLKAYRTGNLSYKLFGAELFNSMTYFKTKRMLHMDFTTILAGSGIVGLILFLSVFYLIIKRSYHFYRIFKSNNTIHDVLAVCVTLMIALMITGIAGTVTGIGLRSVVFLFWGAAFGLIEQNYKKQIVTQKQRSIMYITDRSES